MLKQVLFVILVSFSISVGEYCNVPGKGEGICIDVSKCTQRSGTNYPGYCNGPNSIRCCIGAQCGNQGVCKRESTCNGESTSGLCPGPNDYKCCTSGKTPSKGSGSKIVEAARKQIGKWPYSWGGGVTSGPSKGIKQTISPYCNDSNVVGFDCSGLALYAVYQGTGKVIDHYTGSQYDIARREGKLLPYSQRQPGDLIFFGSSTSNIYHVAIYSGNNKIIEAPGHYSDCRGKPVAENSLQYRSNIIQQVARFW